jgi:hypothetical protein
MKSLVLAAAAERVMQRLKYLITAWLLVLTAGAAHAATFFDGTFNNSDWTEQQLILTGSEPSDPTATFSAGQVLSGGNPGAYLSTTQNYNGPNQSIAVSHLNGTEIWNPGASGGISSISYSFDLNFFNYPGTGSVPSNAVGYAPILYQSGNFYIGTEVVTVSPTWVSFSLSDLTATSFILLNGSSNPNFTISGAPITFGFGSLNGTCCDAPTTTISGLDNWSVTVDTATTPLPSTWFMLLSGFVGLSFFAYCGSKKVSAAVRVT